METGPLPVNSKMAFMSRILILLAILLYEQYIHHTQASICPKMQFLSSQASGDSIILSILSRGYRQILKFNIIRQFKLNHLVTVKLCS